jgi:hypothetical protein
MNYSLADSLRFVRHLTTSDLDTDNVDLLHVIGEHLENLRNSGDESAKELLKEKAQSLGEWVDLNPERTFDFKLEKEEEEQKALLEERRYVRRQIEAIDRQNNEAYLMEREVRLERENNNVANRQNEIARQELVRQCAFILTQLEVENKKFLEFVKSGEAQKKVEQVEVHYGKEKAKTFSNAIELGEVSVVSGISGAMVKVANNPDTPSETLKDIIVYAENSKSAYKALEQIKTHTPPVERDIDNYVLKTNENALILLTNKEHFINEPEYKAFYNSDVYKKFESEVAIIAKQMGAPEPNSPQFKEWLNTGDNKRLFLEAKIGTGMTIESSLNFMSNKQKLSSERAEIKDSIISLKNHFADQSGGIIEGYAKYLDKVQMDIAPKILKEVAVAVTEDAWLNKEHVDKEKFSILKIESPTQPGKFIEMQVYTNQPGNSAEAMRTIVSTVGDKYLKTALDPEFLGFQRNDRQYIGFVSSYLSQYLASDPKMTIVPNATNSNEVVVSKLNAVLMKLTSVRAFINENLDVANYLNLEYLLKNEQLRSQLKEGLMTQIKAERNETPSDEYINLVADKLLSGEFKSTSEFYSQESEFAKEYRIGSGKVNIANEQDKSKGAELADNDDFKNISATI